MSIVRPSKGSSLKYYQQKSISELALIVDLFFLCFVHTVYNSSTCCDDLVQTTGRSVYPQQQVTMTMRAVSQNP